MSSEALPPHFLIREDDLSSEQTRELLAYHLAGMQADSPPGEPIFALDISGLLVPAVTIWTAWRDERIAAMGALKMLADGNGEVKSMRTHPDFLRMGAGAAILDTIIEAAKAKGAHRLSLETSGSKAFEPALAMYWRRGFVKGDPYAGYEENGHSLFLHLDLDKGNGET